MTDLPIHITYEVLQHLEALQIPYMLVGSVASSLRGIARSTIDADVILDLQRDQLQELVSRLESQFYISAEAASEAIRRRSMFNVIQFSSGFKVDLYVLGTAEFERHEFSRRQSMEAEGHSIWVATPEDLILSKLQWYEMGQRISERQWRDVAGLVEIHGEQLDHAYLDKWAKKLNLVELWAKLRP